MKDETKRKLLRALQRGDGAARKGGNASYNNMNLPPTTDDGGRALSDAVDEFDRMTSEELSRELRRQLAYTFVFAALLLAVVGGGIALALRG